jgi:ABC-type bacteriocin/lantibiotic exporter with double-glycine peptidase domain
MTISITHRKRTLKSCDKVIYLKDGSVDKIAINDKTSIERKNSLMPLKDSSNQFSLSEFQTTEVIKSTQPVI